MTYAEQLDYAKRYLRRTKSLVQIKALAEIAAAALLSGETRVTITQQTFEGGISQGQVEFEAAVVGTACESLIEELDETVTHPRRSLGDAVVFTGGGW